MISFSSFSDELVKIALKITKPETKAEIHFLSPEKDWNAFERNLRSKKFQTAVSGNPEADEKLKKYVKNYGGYVSSNNVVAKIKSKDSGKTYSIKQLPNGRLGCSCGDWQYSKSPNKGDCKHIKSVKQSGLLRKEAALKIIPLTAPEHLDEAKALESKVWGGAPAIRKLKKQVLLGAYEDGKLVGLSRLKPDPKTDGVDVAFKPLFEATKGPMAAIESTVVHPDSRGKGIAKALREEAQRRYAGLWTGTGPKSNREAMHRLNTETGFQKVTEKGPNSQWYWYKKASVEGVRITANGVGVYEAVKQAVPLSEWKSLLREPGLQWLPKPSAYGKEHQSWFTPEGHRRFLEETAPLLRRHIPEDAWKTERKPISGKPIYADKYQVITRAK